MGAHHLPALDAEGLAHDTHERVPLRGAHHGEPEARVAGGGFDHSLAGLEEAILLGTNMYLAPEYVRRGEVSPSVDVYAFGVVLLEIITGSPALDNSRSIGMHCYRILDSTYRRLLL